MSPAPPLASGTLPSTSPVRPPSPMPEADSTYAVAVPSWAGLAAPSSAKPASVRTLVAR